MHGMPGRHVLTSAAAVLCCSCRHGPKRPAYLEAFWQVLSWQQVSKNYASAVAGDINTIVA